MSVESLSRISQEMMEIPDRMTFATQSTASSSVPKAVSRLTTLPGFGSRLTMIFVMIPRVPSDPAMSWTRLYPHVSFRILPPIVRTVPEARTTSSPMTCRRVLP